MSNQEVIVRATANQQVTTTDFQAAQLGPQESVDALVAEGLAIVDAYSGLTVTKATDTSVQIAVGRYWKDGPRYRLDAPLDVDLLTHLPQLDNLRVVSLCISGAVIDTDVGLRRFLVDATVSPPVTEPRETETRTKRVVQVSVVPGVQGTAPLNPDIPAGVLEIARVTLSETGIVGVPVMVTDKLVRSLAATQVQLDALQDQLEAQEADLASLRSDLAALSSRVDSKPDNTEFIDLSRSIARLNERFDIPDTKLGAGQDTFDSESESDTGAAGYDAFIDRGALRFPLAAASNQALALLNPADPRLKISNNEVMLPVYDEIDWVGAKAQPNGTIRPLDGAQNGAWNFYRTAAGRLFWFFGGGQNLREMERAINDRGSVKLFDPATNAYVTVDLSTKRWGLSMAFYDRGFAKIRTVDDYPDDDDRKVLFTVAGSAVAQGLIAPGNRWVTGINLKISEKGANGNIHVALCRAKPDGTPDLNRTIHHATVNFADVKVAPQVTQATFALPVLLARGVPYVVVVVTAGGHVLGTTTIDRLNGALFAANDGVSFTAVQDKFLSCELRAAVFQKTRTVVELEPLQLAGGLSNIDFLFYGQEPAAANLVVQGQIGGVWRNLDHTDLTTLTTAPALLPLRLVFKGSETLQPCIHLNKARLIGWRQKTAFTHVSSQRAPSSESEDITVSLILLDFDDAKHDCTVSLLPGPGYNTPVAADSQTVYPVEADPRRKRLVAKFTPDAPGLDDFKIKTVGAATTANDVFAVVNRVDVEK